MMNTSISSSSDGDNTHMEDEDFARLLEEEGIPVQDGFMIIARDDLEQELRKMCDALGVPFVQVWKAVQAQSLD
jgi:hypothetical protein